MEKAIVVVGSINIDLVATASRIPRVGETIHGEDFRIYSGGKGANQAVAAARLGYPVRMIGCVGDDIFSGRLRESLESAGVDTRTVETVPGSSGVALITTGSGGENNIVYVPGANSHVTPRLLEDNLAGLESAGALLTQLEIPDDTVEFLADFAHRRGIPLILDPAPVRQLPSSVLHQTTWLTPNETETNALLKARFSDGALDPREAAASLQESGAQNVLLKLGSRGCYVAELGKPPRAVPAFHVTAIDTTAAGDAFNAGFVVAMLRGYSTAESALYASAVAAISVTRRGAQPSMPTRDEVDAFLAQAAPI